MVNNRGYYPASIGGPVGWIVAGVAVIGIGITYLVDLIGADDQIGTGSKFYINRISS